MDRIQRSHERSRLGRLLLEKGIISEEQLNKAIEQQKITGQKLGEVLTGWNLATQRQINGLLRRQRNLRMATAVATALLGPLQAFAASPAPVTQVTSTQTSTSSRGEGLQALNEEEMGDISAQGSLSQDQLLNLAQHSKDGDGLEVIKDVAKLLNPVLQMLDSETSMKDVVYDPDNAKAVVNKDGSVTLRLPSSIGELSFRNIRVAGDTQGYSLGSIVIRGIDLRGSSVTVLANR